jgi:hypothetical protein
VLASYGHVRDLVAKSGSVRPEEDFAMRWEVNARGEDQLSKISDALSQSSRLILATDPDREGEAISWHVQQVRGRLAVGRASDVGGSAQCRQSSGSARRTSATSPRGSWLSGSPHPQLEVPQRGASQLHLTAPF